MDSYEQAGLITPRECRKTPFTSTGPGEGQSTITQALLRMMSAAAQGGATLCWVDVSYHVNVGRASERAVLDGVSGAVTPRQVLAIMGPSGSGKTSLLNVLACRAPMSKRATLRGHLLINGKNLTNRMGELSAYVEQHEALFALSTVRETLMFTAKLRLPAQVRLEEMQKRVSDTIAELNLVMCADTLVGSNKVRGLSGGERRRVTIGIELLNNPPLCFMDEPTSGLDSFQAQAVMDTLRRLANSGRTVVASIHQPRSSIYQSLDQICLLAGGHTVYFGQAGADLAAHFEKLHLPIPPSYNPADFIIDVVSVNHRDPAAASESTARLDSLVDAWRNRELQTESTQSAMQTDMAAAGPSASSETALLEMLDKKRSTSEACSHSLLAFQLLARRCFQELTRDKMALTIKYAANVFFSLLFGLVYFQMDRSQTSLQNRTGILFFTAMNMAFGVTIDTSSVIPAQLAVVGRERAARMYSIAPYYFANWICRLPLDVIPMLGISAVQYFLAGLRPGVRYFFIYFGICVLEAQSSVALGMLISALLPSVEAAPQLAPLVVILMLIFSGYFLNLSDIPDWIGWIKWISFIRYAFEALMTNEFKDAQFTCTDSSGRPVPVCLDGNMYLAQLNFENTIAFSCAMLGVLAVAFNAVAYVVLVLRRPRFLKLYSNGTCPSHSAGTSQNPTESIDGRSDLKQPFININ